MPRKRNQLNQRCAFCFQSLLRWRSLPSTQKEEEEKVWEEEETVSFCLNIYVKMCKERVNKVCSIPPGLLLTACRPQGRKRRRRRAPRKANVIGICSFFPSWELRAWHLSNSFFFSKFLQVYLQKVKAQVCTSCHSKYCSRFDFWVLFQFLHFFSVSYFYKKALCAPSLTLLFPFIPPAPQV